MYTVDNLPYKMDALEPIISSRTVDIHYNKHHKNYANKLNNILNNLNYDYKYSLVDLIKHIDEFPIEVRDDILFNAGGVLNHNLYWKSMGSGSHIPVGLLKDDINKKFESFNNFKQEFINTANLLVGSGYTFLVLNNNGELEIINTSNQDTPYLYGLSPIMTIDLWEHAYYLDYQNRKSEYINNFFSIIDFDSINKIYEENKKS